MRIKGLAYIIIGSILWGLNGPILDWVFAQTNMTIAFVVSIRLFLSGVLLLLFLICIKTDIFSIFKKRSSILQIALFSIIGVLGLQYTFIGALEASNSILATLFQFSAPIIIVLYTSLINKCIPPRRQIIGIIGTLFGLFLLLTNGSLNNLVVTGKALLFGVGLGLTYVFYTLYPSKLMKEWGIMVILGWSMLFGGLVTGIFAHVWTSNEWHYLQDWNVSIFLIITIVFSTVAYAFFLNSLKFISAVETSILSSIEPLTVMLVSVLWLGTALAPIQLIGAILMLVFVTWLSLSD